MHKTDGSPLSGLIHSNPAFPRSTEATAATPSEVQSNALLILTAAVSVVV
jgi:hypothetical protein